MRPQDVRLLILGLTSKCNGKCITCFHSNANPEADFELSDRVYREVREQLFGCIKELNILSGGEPFLYHNIDGFLEDIRKYTFKTAFDTTLAIMSSKHREMLKDMDVRFVTSLDGSTGELNDGIRPGCPFDMVVDNIKYFVGCGKEVIIVTTVAAHNFYDMHKMVELAEELGVSKIVFQPAQQYSSLDKPFKFELMPEDPEYVAFVKSWVKNVECVTRLGRVKNPHVISQKGCPVPKDTLMIDVGGWVCFCSYGESPKMGNMCNDPLEEIISNEKYDAARVKCQRCVVR